MSFYGGEPLTQFALIRDLVLFTRRLIPDSVSVHVDTNGTLLKKRLFPYLVNNDVHLQVSIDGPRSIHDANRVYRGGRGTHRDIMRNLAALRAYDQGYYAKNVSFAATIAPPYDLPALEQFLQDTLLRENYVRINFVNRDDTDYFVRYSSYEDEASLARQKGAMHEHYVSCRVRGTDPGKISRELYDRPLVFIHRRSRTAVERITANGICAPGVRRLFVSVEGDLFPCERVGNAFKIGDVRTGIDETAVHDMVDTYIAASESECRGCWAGRLCKLCFAAARVGAQFSPERKREHCHGERARLASELVTYVSILEKNPKALDFMDAVTVR